MYYGILLNQSGRILGEIIYNMCRNPNYKVFYDWEQKHKEIKNKFSQLLDFIFFGLLIIVVFAYLENNFKLPMSFGFWGLCLCFSVIFIDIKKLKNKKGN